MATVKMTGFSKEYVSQSWAFGGAVIPYKRLRTETIYDHVGVPAASVSTYAPTQGGTIIGGQPTGGGSWTLQERVVSYGTYEVDTDVPS